MTITELCQRRDIPRDQAAARLGITQAQLLSLDAGQAYFGEATIYNIAKRLNVPPRIVQMELERARNSNPRPPTPFYLRELQDKVNAIWTMHRGNAKPFLVSEGVAVNNDVPERVLKTWLGSHYLKGIWHQEPGVDGVDTFRVLGHVVNVEPPGQESSSQ